MTSKLFSPITVGNVEFKHRAWVPPMCMYSCTEEKAGVVNDFHMMHYGAFALGGAALIMAEATGVSPEGRISPNDTGIWTNEQAEAWQKVVAAVHSIKPDGAPAGQVKMGIQLAHAGRKASTYREFDNDKSGSIPGTDGGWQTYAPTKEAFTGLTAPKALSESEIKQIISDFVEAAKRALIVGFDVIEIHAAHGYLIHEFLSPLSNTRDDQWGSDTEGRSRILTEILAEVRRVVPKGYPIFVRFSGTDWTSGGIDEKLIVEYAKLAKAAGADFVDMSSGGLIAEAKIPANDDYQIHFATVVKEGAGIPTSAVGRITKASQAEDIIATDKADAVFIGRAALNNPSWFKHAARELGLSSKEQLEIWPAPHGRGLPH
ncbi:MAG: NADH:flavin oxidoreductase/NADH oxidase [Micrococcaceae bacterium]